MPRSWVTEVERAKRRIVKERTKTRKGRGREVAEAIVAKEIKRITVLWNNPLAPTPKMPPIILATAGHGPATLRTITKIVTGLERGRRTGTGTMKETGIGTDGEMTDTERETETPKKGMHEGEIEMKIPEGQAAEKDEEGAEEAVTGEIELTKCWGGIETGEEIAELLYPRPFKILMALIFLQSNVLSLLPPLQPPPRSLVHRPVANGIPAADPTAQTSTIKGKRNEDDDRMTRKEKKRSTGAGPVPPPSPLHVIMNMNRTVLK